MKLLKARLYQLEIEKEKEKQKNLEIKRKISLGVVRFVHMYFIHIILLKIIVQKKKQEIFKQ